MVAAGNEKVAGQGRDAETGVHGCRLLKRRMVCVCVYRREWGGRDRLAHVRRHEGPCPTGRHEGPTLLSFRALGLTLLGPRAAVVFTNKRGGKIKAWKRGGGRHRKVTLPGGMCVHVPGAFMAWGACGHVGGSMRAVNRVTDSVC